MKRVEEFTQEGRSFVYIDLSNIKTAAELLETTEEIKPIIAKYPPESLYTVTNIADFNVDSEKKDILTAYLSHNKPYVKFSAVIGMDGVKKIMTDLAFKITGRPNILFAYSKDKAIELLMEK